MRYVYADACICKYAHIGDEEAFKHVQDLAHQRRLAEEDRRAAGPDRPAVMDWGEWLFDESW